ncbi:MAG: hypothetical protein RLZZ426_322 [Actinomycetota bacterium]
MNETPAAVPPWEPPMAGSELEHLLAAINRQRATFRWKISGVDAAGLNLKVGNCSLTLGGLIKHMAIVEDYVFTHKLAGTSIGEPWASTYDDAVPDWEFVTAVNDSPEDLCNLWEEAIVRTDARLSEALQDSGLEQLVWISDQDRGQASLRRLLFDFLEEYARHMGHADLLRENIDGLVGEDPPFS